MDVDSRLRTAPGMKVAFRLLVKAVRFFALVAFVLPGAYDAITGSESPPTIHSWKSAVALAAGSLVVATVAEVLQRLLTGDRRTR